MKILNPATNTLIKDINEDTTSTVLEKFNLAKTAQLQWQKKSLDERLACIQKFEAALDKNKESLAKDLTSEVGKPYQESLNEINGARNRIRFFLENSKKWLTENNVNQDGSTKEVLSYDALGVIANISAWNYPFLVGTNVFIPALIAGNAVLYKPSEYATLTGLNIEKLMRESGIPAGVFTAVIGDAKAGEALLDLPLDGYFFTGSYKTGRAIAQKVANKLVPVGMELGGKDPLYVTDDVADLKQVAGAVAEGCFYNNGQSCCAVERVYVNENVYSQFMEHFTQEVKALKAGDPMDKAHNVGAVTRPVHIGFLESQIKEALDKGAQLVCGGKKIPGPGSFFEPTVLTNVNHSMRVMMEETFGPVIGIMKVTGDEEAIKLMNDCEYGLTAAVYSKNIDRAKNIVGQVNAGTSYINCCDRVSPYLPWAGRKNSGLGSTLSYLGILAFAKPRGWHIRG
ncbi:MAG: aldehyde dehydrogenase family protein [Pseudobdellovibrionaceae bacterium]